MKFDKTISVVLAGEAGQGLKTVEFFITRALKQAGYNVFATKEYMSRIRGGCNTTQIRISSERISAYSDKIDILVPLNTDTIKHLQSRINPDIFVIGDKSIIDAGYAKLKLIDLPLLETAKEIGGKIYMNVLAAGLIISLFDVEQKSLADIVLHHFTSKGKEIAEKNQLAVEKGYELGRNLKRRGKLGIDIKRNPEVSHEMLINGAEAVSLGAIAGGCNFISSYPMSPSTGVLVFLSKYGKKFGIVSEQAEDEISAINMASGAWYAGARAIATTSGGGFALMEEGLSLAGMIESPAVIHLAQRPGPATGLPTRTEQGDLNLALYAGHGEFSRIIFAPGTLEQGFHLAQQAFNLADKYQVPVIILTDQYYVDSYYNIPKLRIIEVKVEKHIVKTDKNYKRYKLTKDGVSLRGVPGYGEGIVSVDSDEHDEEGHITEDLALRDLMVKKRMKKLELIKSEAIEPELIGNDNYKTLLVAWGSTRNVIKEALEKTGNKDFSFLHFSQVYPLHENARKYFSRAEKIIAIENNETGQFAELLIKEFNIKVERKILKYNGLPFSVEEIIAKLKEE